jgi:ribosomal protein S8
MVPYLISDLLARLNSPKKVFTISYNLELLAIISILQSIGILTYTIINHTILISLRNHSFSHFTLHSKPSRRIYKSYKELATHNSGVGISIIRTSQGFHTLHQAKSLRLGGELLFTI